MLLGLWAGAALAAGEPVAGAVSATTVKLPDGPGSVRGLSDAASVSVFSAQVSYSVPLELPKAQGGLSPSVSLSYSGELGNGPVGVGWSLPVASIRRSTRLGVPAYGTDDELELVGVAGGGRLVPLTDGTLVLEGRGRAVKVERLAEGGFRLTENGGVRYTFGATAAGRQAEGHRVAAWFAEEVVHPTGARVAMTYLHDRGQVYLSGLAWGPRDVYQVELKYGARADTSVSYRSGIRVETALRLSEVWVWSHGEVLRAYVLDYGQAAGKEQEFGLSRLRRLTMVGRGLLGSLPSLTFSYAPLLPSQVQPLQGVDGWVLNHDGINLADVDGDGMTDLLRLGLEEDSYKKGLGNGFGPTRPIGGAEYAWLEQARLLDVDGDSRPELVQATSESLLYSRLSGEAFGEGLPWQGGEGLPLFGSDVVFADFNGDRLIDYLWGVSEGMGFAFGGPSGLRPFEERPPIDGVALQPGPGVHFLEVNGDGLTDAVQLGGGWWQVYLGKGDGTFVNHGLHAYPWGESTILEDVRLADLNRDGLMDLIYILGGHVQWYRGRADGSVDPTPREVLRPDSEGLGTVVAIADVNGNGSEDVVWSSVEGMWALDIAGPTTAGMLVGIDNGMGKTVSIAYGASAQLSVAAEAAGNPWLRRLPVSIPVPTAMEVSPGAEGPVRRVEYSVRDGFWDAEEQRFGGFLVGAVRTLGATVAETLYEETRFHPGEGEDRALRGEALEVRQENGEGVLYTRSTATYEARDVDGLTAALPGQQRLVRLPAELEARTYHYEGLTTPLQTLTTYAYDARVRVVEERQFGRLDLQGDEKLLQRAFGHDDATWVHDVVCEERLYAANQTTGTDGKPALQPAASPLSHARTYYGDASTTYTWETPADCRVGRGLVRKTLGLLIETQAGVNTSRWVTLTEARYDAYDNVTASFGGGVWRYIAFDTDSLFFVNESVTPEAGRTLTWRVEEWDKVLGMPKRIVDANGITSSAEYDSLGRLSSIATAGHSPHVHYTYDWTAPTPRTWTFAFDGALADLPGSWTDNWMQGGKWRQSVNVTNGAGEALYTATRLAASQWIVSEWRERDARGKVVYAADNFYAASLPTERPTAVTGQSFAYDALGRLVRQTLPTGISKTTSYKAFETTFSTPGLAPVSTHSDGFERIVRTQRTVAGIAESVTASYDAADRITAMRLNEGAVTHSFTYDTLGRLSAASDPDLGARTLQYNDLNQLTHHTNGADQTRRFFYDAAGRLTRTLGEDGTSFIYHYDVPRDGSAGKNTANRLAWVEEPRGEFHVAYDVFGRSTSARRRVDTFWAEETSGYSPSGLLLFTQTDGVRVDAEYDAAARPKRLGSYWEALEVDASGRLVKERYGNGVTEDYHYDSLGLPDAITVRRPSGALLYDVTLKRNAWAAPTEVWDVDGTGLDHSATFTYDEAARLTDAVLGAVKSKDAQGRDVLIQGPASFRFTHTYDGLQNMLSRTVQGPKALGLLAGTYHYGERGFGPRQLSSVTKSSGDAVLLNYDKAGRVVGQAGRQLSYNGLDQLVQAVLPAEGDKPQVTVDYAYGYEGLRTFAQTSNGDVQHWFSPTLTQRGGTREWYLKIGDRMVVRLNLAPTTLASASTTASQVQTTSALHEGTRVFLGGLLVMATLCVLGLTLLASRTSGRLARLTAGLTATALFSLSCAPGLEATDGASLASPLWATQDTVYFHSGIAAGPVLSTREDASVHEERRYEPFGTPIDAYRETAGGLPEVGDVNHRDVPLNALNKESDADTGFSYHGARWMAPLTATWLTPDPLVKAPDPELLSGPWSLNPYQYASQNPVVYWDPDGWVAAPIGYVYVIEGTLHGQPVHYVGSTAQELQKRFSAHKWKQLIQSIGTTVTVQTIEADLDVAASGRGTVRSATNEALRAGEQTVMDRKASARTGSREPLNEVRAASKENTASWLQRHKVKIGRAVKFNPGRVTAASFAGFAVLDVAMMYRDAKLAQYGWAPHVFQDEGGVFTVGSGQHGWFNAYYTKTYVDGPLSGQTFNIGKEDFNFYKAEGEALYGYIDWAGDWSPGLLRTSLPVVQRSQPNDGA
jgi:RHS repeat-associated protein